MSPAKFDSDAFYATLDAERTAKRLTWKKVAEQSGVSASTLTRISQGKRPDVDSLTALCVWGGFDANRFSNLNDNGQRGKPSALAEIVTHLRADRNLSRPNAEALEAIIKTAYERMKSE